MNRSLRLSVLLALALGSAQAAAVQLGQVQVKSALGQPLLAEIPVTPSSPGELASLHAQLAPSDDFARAGIADGRPSIPLQFGLVGEGGHKVIRITSAQPVNEPYLDLLVEVSTRAGKSVREVTILLDPPGTYAAPAAAPAPAAPRRTTPRSAPAPAAPAAAPAAAAPAPATPAPAPQGSAGTYGPVQRGDTLSAIARKEAPAGVDANQMLLALQHANPDAFYRDNINALKSGAILRVPSQVQAQALNAVAAMAEVRRQNQEWTANNAAPAPTTVADAATRPGASSAPADKGAANDRLALVPPKNGGSANGTGDKAASKLRQDLLRSQESLTTLQQQSSELKSRLKDLEDINGKNQRLLSLKDNEIAELQHKLAEARKAESQPAAPAPTGAAVAPATPASNGATRAAPSQVAAVPPAVAPASTSAAPAAMAAANQAANKPATTPASAKPVPAKPVPARHAKPAARPANGTVEAPWYMQTWVWEAAAGAVVLLLLLALLARRRGKTPAAAPATSSSLADRFGSVTAAASDDPDQDELLDQLAEHPDDVGLHLELVGLYYTRRDIERFEAAAEAMHAHIADPEQPEWLDVLAMGEDLDPGHPLFAGGAQEAEDRFAAEADDDRTIVRPLDDGSAASDFGDFAGGQEAVASGTAAVEPDHYDPGFGEPEADDLPAAMPPRPAQKKVSEYHFDFNLTPPRPAAAPVPPAPAAEPEPGLASSEEPAVEMDVDDSAPVASSWNFEEPADGGFAQSQAGGSGDFSDDPIDTKLDLARAYLDMGDAEGARAMLEEVMAEGSQLQKETAGGLLESMR